MNGVGGCKSGAESVLSDDFRGGSPGLDCFDADVGSGMGSCGGTCLGTFGRGRDASFSTGAGLGGSPYTLPAAFGREVGGGLGGVPFEMLRE